MNISDRPPQPTPIDKIISLHHGSTTVIEATPQRLRASKHFPILSSPEMIKQLQKQIHNLDHELAYYQAIMQGQKEFNHNIDRLIEKFVIKLDSSHLHNTNPERLGFVETYISSISKIEQLQRQNSRLAHEIAYYQDLEQPRKDFDYKLSHLIEEFAAAVTELNTRQKRIRDVWAQPHTSHKSETNRIEQLQKQNSSLRHEIAYYRELEQSWRELVYKVARLRKRLEMAVTELGRSQQRVGDEWAQRF